MTKKGKRKPNQPPRKNPEEGSSQGTGDQASTSGAAHQDVQMEAAAAPPAVAPRGLAAATAAMAAMDIDAPKGAKLQQQRQQQAMPLRENVQAPPAAGPRGWGRGQSTGPPPQKLPGAVPPLATTQGLAQQLDRTPPSGLTQLTTPAAAAATPSEAAKSTVAIEVKFSVPPNRTIGVSRPDNLVSQRPPLLQANLYPLTINLPEVYHYDVEITRIWEPSDPKNQPKYDAPKKSKPLPRDLARKLFEKAVEVEARFFSSLPVFDGNRNVYTKKPLALNPGTIKIITFEYMEVIGNQTKPGKFTMNIKPAERIDEYEEFVKFSKKKKSSNVQHVVDLELINEFYKKDSPIKQIPQECLAAIGTILRHAPSIASIPVKHGFFTREQYTSLPGGLELWYGYNFSVHVGQDRLYLNVDRGLATFYPEGSLLDYVAFVFDTKNLKTLKPHFFKSKAKYFSGIKFYLKHLDYAKQHSIWKISTTDAREQRFDLEGKSIDVFNYFRGRGEILKYPNLPLVICGSANKTTYYPMELCFILGNQPHFGQVTKDQQAAVIKQSAVHPEKRFGIIHSGLKSFKKVSAKNLDYFGIQVGEQMLQVPGHQLQLPQLVFREFDRRSNKVADFQVRANEKGSWNAKGFYQGATLSRWILITFVNLKEVSGLVESIVKAGPSHNMTIKNPIVWEERGDGEENIKNVFQKCRELEKSKNVQCQLIFVVLSDTLNKAFLKFKGDYEFKIPTVCATWGNVRAKFFNNMFIGNLLLKINLKLKGINYKLAPASTPELMKNSIIIGVNITHSGPRDQNKSYAAVVANMDSFFNFYQEEITKPTSHEDILANLREMLVKLLTKYAAREKAVPKRVVVFRDGVGEGQYPEIIKNELPIVKGAYKKAFPSTNQDPLITFSIGLRRNNMRFLPTTYKGNVPPGTVVDAASNPYEFEFYLCSHHGIQGTSAPTKYTMLHDDNKLKSRDFAQLIFCLSHLYPRCFRSISVPSVMRSAQHYAVRGKEYAFWQSLDDDDDEGEE